VTVNNNGDTTPPVISGIAASGITASGATINWTTNEASDSQVDYGLTAAYGSASALNTTDVTVHSIALNGMAASTTYHYRVRSRDAANNLATSGDFTLTTVDGTAPTVSLSAPAAGATVSGSISVSATASDNVGVAGVQFRLDGAVLGAEDVAAPYTVSWNTLTATNGSHTLTAVARDAATNQTTSVAVSVTVANDTTLPVISAVTASSITGSGATISWTTNEASDSQVDYGLTTAYGSASALNNTDVTAHAVGLSGLTGSTLYHVRVRSRDAAGNLALSGDVTFTTQGDVTSPTVSISAPTAGATVGGAVTVTANASDNVGVAGVQFRLDGAPLEA
jgi:phosphodiesterase/alkaline phosphatase D-like protein